MARGLKRGWMSLMRQITGREGLARRVKKVNMEKEEEGGGVD